MTGRDETIDELAAKGRDELTARANDVRSKLLHTVEVLDRRRHDALDVRRQVAKHAAPLAVTAGVVVVGMVATTALITHRLGRRRERMSRFSPVWRRAERAAPPPSLLAQLGRSLLVGILSAAILIPAQGILKRLYR
jgi:hypothetical protein